MCENIGQIRIIPSVDAGRIALQMKIFISQIFKEGWIGKIIPTRTGKRDRTGERDYATVGKFASAVGWKTRVSVRIVIDNRIFNHTSVHSATTSTGIIYHGAIYQGAGKCSARSIIAAIIIRYNTANQSGTECPPTFITSPVPGQYAICQNA